MPVVEVDGDAFPKIMGEGGFNTTPSGKTIVRHPNAYGYRTIYHRSTLRIEVGRDWRHHELVSHEEGRVTVWLAVAFCRGFGDWSFTPYHTGFGRTGLLVRHASGWSHHVATGEDVGGWKVRALDFAEPRKMRLVADYCAGRMAAQKAADLAAKANSFSGMSLLAVPVTVGSSVRAGNCREGTLLFARRHKLGDQCPASTIMGIARDNHYALRAIALAAKECCETISI